MLQEAWRCEARLRQRHIRQVQAGEEEQHEGQGNRKEWKRPRSFQLWFPQLKDEQIVKIRFVLRRFGPELSKMVRPKREQKT